MSIKKNFSDMIYKNLEEYGTEIIENNKYRELTDEYNKIFNKISDYLPEEDRDLIYKLDAIENNISSIAEKMFYEKGLKDGLELKNILKTVG